MLDDMRVLRGAVERYRRAATAAGVPWGTEEPADALGVEALCRVFDVDRVAEQAIWFHHEGLPYAQVLPEGGHPLPWDNADNLLGYLSMAVGVPFPWRHQLPLLISDRIVFAFVLAGDHEGEIWRYQIEVDDRNPVRAATSLAALVSAWTDGFAAGVYARSPYDTWLHVGPDDRDPVDVLVEGGLDPFAFPVHVSAYSHHDLLRARQRECGVDPDQADDFDRQEALLEAVDVALASLRA
ncbi:hypothetical protein CO540_06675 [Micromonospora sp. WMMA2032]|uniref:hypothetical protein n=1 Tax=Micromonospora sp. WMMA2032 TaxID=2039870 RepID=UPI000C05BB2D|nr:hypothetical protein [Micromonospora sp. WMMA2032]ATO13558.1 hypothetical protein CO540_06675 [Micromonospora sp. WMMA2032]